MSQSQGPVCGALYPDELAFCKLDGSLLVSAVAQTLASSIRQKLKQSASPSYKLFDPGSVGFATLFGSPIAGAFLMALNYRRLGKMAQAGQ